MAMAGIVADDLTSLIKISVKSRSDTFTDQYNRIFVLRMCMVSAMVMGVSYFKDSMNCIVHEDKIDAGFVASACWIQGLYIYEEMKTKTALSYHYGMPRKISDDGLTPGGDVCPTVDEQGYIANPAECAPMTKVFFLQYQYMPFYVCVIGIFYYIPYLFYLACNDDMISLRTTVKGEEGEGEEDDEAKTEKIVKHYFKRSKPGRATSMRMRVLFNILVKVAYIGVNLFAIFGTNHILNGKYIRYGERWMTWTARNNSQMYDYTMEGTRNRAGDELLPSFGYCEITETVEDELNIKNNVYKFQCELSQDVLYQYCLFVVWMVMIIGLVLSVVGLILLILHYVLSCFVFKKDVEGRVYSSLYFREIEYLEYIRKKSIPLYKQVCEKLLERTEGAFAQGKRKEAYELKETRPLVS